MFLSWKQSLRFATNHLSASVVRKQLLSTSRIMTNKLSDGSLIKFVSSLLNKPVESEIAIPEGDTLVKNVVDTIKKNVELREGESDALCSLLTEMKACEESTEDARSMLKAIGENVSLQSVLVASKREISAVDYCAYYLLSPLMQSIQSTEGIESLAAYYMRMQNNKLVRTSTLSPPVLQLKPKKAKQQAQQSPQTQQTPLTPEECLAQLDIRVGRIVKAWNHPDSDKLICEQVDVGEASPRSIGSGIRAFHSAESMEGRLVCVMSNMKPRKLAGYPSNGMLLCASTSDHSKGALCTPPAGSIVGERIQFEGITGEPATPNQVSKKKMVETVLEFLKTDVNGVCCFKNIPFTTSAGVCTCKEYSEESIS